MHIVHWLLSGQANKFPRDRNEHHQHTTPMASNFNANIKPSPEISYAKRATRTQSRLQNLTLGDLKQLHNMTVERLQEWYFSKYNLSDINDESLWRKLTLDELRGWYSHLDISEHVKALVYNTDSKCEHGSRLHEIKKSDTASKAVMPYGYFGVNMCHQDHEYIRSWNECSLLSTAPGESVPFGW